MFDGEDLNPLQPKADIPLSDIGDMDHQTGRSIT